MTTTRETEAVRKIWTTGLVLLAGVAAVLIMALIAGCAQVCQRGAMHCLGSKVELCDPKGHWRQVMDCADVGPKGKAWRCCCLGDKKGRCSCQVAP